MGVEISIECVVLVLDCHFWRKWSSRTRPILGPQLSITRNRAFLFLDYIAPMYSEIRNRNSGGQIVVTGANSFSPKEPVNETLLEIEHMAVWVRKMSSKSIESGT